MKLILQKDVKNLGKVGDVVRVKQGYARNYLIPKKLAFHFNESFAKELNHKKRIIESRKKQALLERKALVDQLASVQLEFLRESRDEGSLFGSVTVADISLALEKEHKILVDKKDIQTEPLKKVGEHNLTVAFDSENTGTLKVIVKSKKTSEAKKKKFGLFSFTTNTSETEESSSQESEDKPLENSEATSSPSLEKEDGETDSAEKKESEE